MLQATEALFGFGYKYRLNFNGKLILIINLLTLKQLAHHLSQSYNKNAEL